MIFSAEGGVDAYMLNTRPIKTMTKTYFGIVKKLKAAHLPKTATAGSLVSIALSTGAALAVGLAPAQVQAKFFLDKTSGTWSNPVGENTALSTVTYQTVGLQNQIRWGSGDKGKSGLGFTGEDYTPSLQLIPETNFLLGTLQHFNNPIETGTAISSVTLNLAALFEGPPVSINFLYSTIVDETPNTGKINNCDYSSTVACADKISINSVSNQSTFKIGNDEFTIASFFLDNNGAPTNSLISQEGGTTTAQVFGRLTTKLGQTPIDPPRKALWIQSPAPCPAWVLLQLSDTAAS